MELWIRSQDKERLCKPNNLFIKNYAICCSYNEQSNDTDYLGVYKTKERTLEILDEIQNILRPQILVRVLDYVLMGIFIGFSICYAVVMIIEIVKAIVR